LPPCAHQNANFFSLNAPERLRASVKEKEMKIEQLIKERDLVSARIPFFFPKL
jgi:SpoVK/Ycf46/Vps4 family AAA+-type ATPase